MSRRPHCSAADRWRAQLEAWALPQGLLDSVSESPYGWPVGLFRRWVADTDPTPTTDTLASLLPPNGLLLDVGAGTGRIAIPFGEQGHPVIAVERDVNMAAALEDEAAQRGLRIELVKGSWPEAAETLARADVAVCANVVYDVAAINPFVAALDQAASAVIIELTEDHPWSYLTPLYEALHGLERPPGPTAELFVELVRQVTDRDLSIVMWERPPALYFESWDEILRLYAKRLLVGPERHVELRNLLEPDVVWDGGRARIGGPRRMATVWWKSV